jgi:hypothetical protein
MIIPFFWQLRLLDAQKYEDLKQEDLRPDVQYAAL